MRTNNNRLFIFPLCLIFITGAAGTFTAAPKNRPAAKSGDCGACHGREKVLPNGHENTRDMAHEACAACHRKDGAAKPLRGKIPLSHTHRFNGVACADCHGKRKKNGKVTMRQCLSCHGDTDKLAAKTSNVKPENPHTSPHYGNKNECGLCHHVHSRSENYCAQCHTFSFTVP